MLQVDELTLEVVRAAEAIRRPGALALDHKRLASCNFGNTVASCMEIGLQSPYDCSGYTIDVLSKVQGRSTEDWSPDRRHVRQLYDPAIGRGNPTTQWSQLELGKFAILGRVYTFGTQNRLVPAHVGIVVAHDVERGTVTLSHAHARLGQVVASIVSFDNPRYQLIGMASPAQLIG